MKKKAAFAVLSLVVAVGAVGFMISHSSASEAKNDAVVVDRQVEDTLPVVEFSFKRYKEYSELSELKQESHLAVVATFVEKKPARKVGEMMVYSENVFRIDEVIKGDQALVGANILVNESGGIYEGKKYKGAGNELFDEGKYLLFVDKVMDQELPYELYYVKGVTAGKYKISKGKVKGYGEDKVREKAGKLTEKELLKAIKIEKL